MMSGSLCSVQRGPDGRGWQCDDRLDAGPPGEAGHQELVVRRCLIFHSFS